VGSMDAQSTHMGLKGRTKEPPWGSRKAARCPLGTTTKSGILEYGPQNRNTPEYSSPGVRVGIHEIQPNGAPGWSTPAGLTV